MNEITIGDKVYISAKRAAEITGYARDYVGQLCREGHIEAKMVGRSWYVYEPSIRAHRFGSDAVAPVITPEEVTPLSVEEVVTPPVEVMETMATWNSPTYTAQEPQELPHIEAPVYQEILPPAEESLTDMQSAWKEWFERKQQELQTPEIESAEIIDARNEEEEEAEYVPEEPVEDEDEVSVPLHRVQEAVINEEEEDQGEEIAIHRVVAPVPVYPEEVVYTRSIEPRYVAEYAEDQVGHGRIVEERIVAKATQTRRITKKRRSTRSTAPITALLIAVSIISLAVAAVGSGVANSYVSKSSIGNNPFVNFLVGTHEVNTK